MSGFRHLKGRESITGSGKVLFIGLGLVGVKIPAKGTDFTALKLKASHAEQWRCRPGFVRAGHVTKHIFMWVLLTISGAFHFSFLSPSPRPRTFLSLSFFLHFHTVFRLSFYLLDSKFSTMTNHKTDSTDQAATS